MEQSVQAPDDWNSFVAACDPPHFEQTSYWGEVEAPLGWQSHYVTARLGRRLVAGALVLVRRSGRFGLVGYIKRGPLSLPQGHDAEATAQHVIKGLRTFAEANRLGALIVVPPYRGQALVSRMSETGFSPHPWVLPPERLPKGTIVHDCRLPKEEMLATFRRSTRQEINRGIKRGFTMRRGGAADLPAFWDLVGQLCKRRGSSPNIHGFPFIERMWRAFEPPGMARLYVGEVAEKVVAALLCIRVQHWLYAWRIGWSSEHPETFPTKSLYWHVMQAAAQEGIAFLDFMEINTDDVRAAATSDAAETPKTSTFSTNFFKLGFGGTVIELPPAMDYFPNPLFRLPMRTGLGKVLDHPQVMRFLKRLC